MDKLDEDTNNISHHENETLFSSVESTGTNIDSYSSGRTIPEKSKNSSEIDFKKLREPFTKNFCSKEIEDRRHIIENHMGSMALTRGKLGEKLREAGGEERGIILILRYHCILSHNFSYFAMQIVPIKAITNLLSLLFMLICNHTPKYSIVIEDKELIKLIIVALGKSIIFVSISLSTCNYCSTTLSRYEGALRDLACGNASNRLAIGNFVPERSDKNDLDSGIDIIAFFIHRYHGQCWESILCTTKPDSSHDPTKLQNRLSYEPTERGKLHLKILTAAVGVFRNITHGTKTNCEALHSSGMTIIFSQILMNDTASSLVYKDMGSAESKAVSRLPDASKPWRECCFRLASSLINMAEKCIAVAEFCANNDALIYLLLESWGGVSIYNSCNSKKGYSVLHIGLKNILRLRLNNAQSTGAMETLIHHLFVRESIRKKAAQQREIQRKSKLILHPKVAADET